MTSSTSAQPDAASFRDPSGQVVWHQHRPYRLVHQPYQSNFDLLKQSGLLELLWQSDLLIRHQEVKAPFAVESQVSTVLRPDVVPFISYPYEWCFSQLQDAALLTLEIQKLALEHNMSLKDASAYNVQFLGAHPIFIDTLSFESLTFKPWVAYRQFCQHFLAPLVLMSSVDYRLQQLLRTSIDGIPLELASTLLPWHSRLSPSLMVHVHLHASSQRKHAADGKVGRSTPSGEMSKQSLLGLIDNLYGFIRGLSWQGNQTEWADYYERNNNYTDASINAKAKLVEQYLKQTQSRTVWDLGGNTGRFSQIAVEAGAATVCWDIDPMAVESFYRQLKIKEQTKILPLVQDFSNPSPDLGWNLLERQSIQSRGPVDTVMALALVHHLAIGNNVPLPNIAAWLAGLCSKYAIVEFIPKQDSQLQKLLATREDIFDDYSIESFEQSFTTDFNVISKKSIPGSSRYLYLLQHR